MNLVNYLNIQFPNYPIITLSKEPVIYTSQYASLSVPQSQSFRSPVRQTSVLRLIGLCNRSLGISQIPFRKAKQR